MHVLSKVGRQSVILESALEPRYLKIVTSIFNGYHSSLIHTEFVLVNKQLMLVQIQD